ncbi:LamB/YcsF family protein [Phycicoccus sp. MAQZ13P-2]|nr:LamB/YcsF family protein [Phycicoccus mangrovi]MBT9274945.1 LamB/YcsF family protein [Phycicoccus mangrovi]
MVVPLPRRPCTPIRAGSRPDLGVALGSRRRAAGSVGAVAAVIDLNADLGESFGAWTLGDDAAMLRVVTSANVACGFHAGDPTTIRRTVAQAAAAGVVVGAQVGYRDLAGFGRRRIDVAPEDLTADVLYQLGALEAMCRVAGTRVRYVKPHGALYTTAAVDEGQARAVVGAVVAWDASLPVMGLPGSVLLAAAADAGLATVAEAFADRGYDATGRLVSRRDPGALVTDPVLVAARVVRMVRDGVVEAVDGTLVPVAADSVCVHGDTPGAVVVAQAVRDALAAAGIGLRAVVEP